MCTTTKLKREIYSTKDLEDFKTSDCFKNVLSFIEKLNLSVSGIAISCLQTPSEIVLKILDLLLFVESWIRQYPPVAQNHRYGNQAFKDWFDQLKKCKSQLLSILPSELNFHLMEIYGWIQSTIFVSKVPIKFNFLSIEYFENSWGNKERIDYGTGHELSFISFLYCLHTLNIVQDEDCPALVLLVFSRYLDIIFTLQDVYWLEPAGSHGVWGLDDYNFLPFYFGSSQLIGHSHIKPSSIRCNEYLEEYSKDYLYLKCVLNINKVKTVSLQWHSPMLNDISGVKSWEKVNSGLLKMYKVEVLGKLPIMQHFLFGSLLSFKSSHSNEKTETSLTNHSHHFCCISRIPSAAAAKAFSENMNTPNPIQ